MRLTTVIEALLFASEKPLTVARIQSALRDAAAEEPTPEAEAIKDVDEAGIREAIVELDQELGERGGAVTVQEIAKGFQLRTRSDAALWVGQLREGPKPPRLSPPALETLAIIAYRQPLTRADMEAIRGVAVDGVVATLLERKYIAIAGRSEQPGRPLLYETTPDFLQDFGLRHLDDLPNADELRRINIGTAKQGEEAATSPETPDTAPEEGTPENETDAVASAEEATQEAAESSEKTSAEMANDEEAEDSSEVAKEPLSHESSSHEEQHPTAPKHSHESEAAPESDRPVG